MGFDVADLRRRFLAAQLVGDRREAVHVVVDEGLARGAGALELELDVVQEAQREIGRLWVTGEIPVGDEHMATAVAQAALHELAMRAPRARPVGKTVLVACVPGELHELPARLVGDALDLSGYRVLFMGASTPSSSLIEKVADGACDMLALSVTVEFNLPAMRKALILVREVAPRLPIVVGGQAMSPSVQLAAELGVDATDGDARTIVARADRLLGVRR